VGPAACRSMESGLRAVREAIWGVAPLTAVLRRKFMEQDPDGWEGKLAKLDRELRNLRRLVLWLLAALLLTGALWVASAWLTG
jgi:hypothetical protein